MPYDDMDRFVAFSKCLAGFGPDRVIDDNRFRDLASKIIVQMHKLLDRMDHPEPQSFGEAAAEFVDKHGGLVTAPGVGVTPLQNTPAGKSPPTALRDDLLRSCRIIMQSCARGVSFEDITKEQLGLLSLLAEEATKFRAAVERYQLQNRGRR
jgi:hypothetical protein